MTDRAAPQTAPALTIAHQGLAACLAQIVGNAVIDDGTADAIAMGGEFLPHAHGDGPLAEALVLAMQGLLSAWPARNASPGGVPWAMAVSAARHAVTAYYRQRAAACHARIFPETQEKDAAHA